MSNKKSKMSTPRQLLFRTAAAIFIPIALIFAASIPALIMAAINTHYRLNDLASTSTSFIEAPYFSGSPVTFGDFVHVNYEGLLQKGFDIEAWKLVSITGDFAPLADGAYGQIGDKLYLFGGSQTTLSNVTDKVYEIDLEQNTMTEVTTTGPNHGAWTFDPYAGVDAENGDIYLYGGWDGGGSLFTDYNNELHKYNVATSTFTFIPTTNNPGNRTAGTMIVYDGFLYLFGGFGVIPTLSYYDEMYRLNLTNPVAWEVVTPTTSPPSGRAFFIWQKISGTKSVLFSGSTSPTTRTNDLWTFDFSNNAWERIQPDNGRFVQPPQRDEARAVMVDDRYMYMYAGKDGSAILDDYWVLDTNLWVWRELNSAGLVPVFGHYMGVVPSAKDVLIFGGFTLVTLTPSTTPFRYNRGFKPIGVVTNVAGTSIANVQTYGVVSNSAWFPLTPGLPVYVDQFGNVTQVPSQIPSRTVGTAVSSSAILLFN